MVYIPLEKCQLADMTTHYGRIWHRVADRIWLLIN